MGKKSDLRLGLNLEVRLVKLGGRSLEVKPACWLQGAKESFGRKMKVNLEADVQERVSEEMALWSKVKLGRTDLGLRVTSHGLLQHGRLIQVLR